MTKPNIIHLITGIILLTPFIIFLVKVIIENPNAFIAVCFFISTCCGLYLTTKYLCERDHEAQRRRYDKT